MKKTNVIGLFTVVMICSLFVVVATNPLTVSGYTDTTTYNVVANDGAPVAWGPNWLGNTGTITLSYDGTADFWARVLYTKYGTVTEGYTLWISTDGTIFEAFPGTRTAISNGYTWDYTGDWSTWVKIELRSTSDPSGLPQRL